MLALQLERAARARLDRLIVATSEEPGDDAVAALAEHEGYGCFRGALSDVLDRFYRAARETPADHVVRLTADCPLIDHRVIDRVMSEHVRGGHDYTSNTQKRTFPQGEDVEVMRFATLERAWREASSEYDREHVTPYIYRHPELFRLGSVESAEDWSHYRWTVDYPEDLALVRAVFEALYARDTDFSVADVVELIARRPELLEINAAVNAAAHKVRR